MRLVIVEKQTSQLKFIQFFIGLDKLRAQSK